MRWILILSAKNLREHGGHSFGSILQAGSLGVLSWRHESIGCARILSPVFVCALVHPTDLPNWPSVGINQYAIDLDVDGEITVGFFTIGNHTSGR